MPPAGLDGPGLLLRALPTEISREFLLYHGVCPLDISLDGHLRVAISPTAVARRVSIACADLTRIYERPVERVPCDAAAFEQAVERIATAPEMLDVDDRDEHLGESGIDMDVRNLASQPPVIRYVNFLLREAYDAGASDIHVEATADALRVRFRIDGVLVAGPDAPAGLGAAVVSRMKLIASLDIAERRRPQDGRIRARLDTHAVDLRVSAVPTHFGESVVVRLLDHSHGRVPELEALGMPPEILAAVTACASRSHGLLLVTGPTGSGKTTTLYAALGRRALKSEKVISVEEPVEYELSFVTQVPVNRQAGVTFGSVLRSILRQDPDVIMVGEMRDAETAEIALQAATTGHLVFSTVHTNDAAGAAVRIRDFGIPGFLLAATLDLVLAQRLVRIICSECCECYEPVPSVREAARQHGLEQAEYVRGAGCRTCHDTGYRGRTGVFELFAMTAEVREAVAREASHVELTELAARQGMRPMRAHAAQLVRSRVTTIEEVIRAVL